MDDLWFYVLFSSILVISGPWLGDYESLCVMDLVTGRKDFRLKRGLNLVPLDQLASAQFTELPGLLSQRRNSVKGSTVILKDYMYTVTLKCGPDHLYSQSKIERQ